MEDDSEDLAFFPALSKHLRLFFWTFPVTYVTKLFSGENAVGTTKLEISLSLFAVATAALVFYQTVELLRRWVASVRALRRLRCSGAPVLAGGMARDRWEVDKGPLCGVCALRGRRGAMEDRFSVVRGDDAIHLYGVFDGHGGQFAAEFAEKHLLEGGLLGKLQGASEGEFVGILTQHILELDARLLLQLKANRDVAGTTALVAVVRGGSTLIVANVGDSRGVLCDARGNAVPLSFDHKPDQLKERRRIRAAGGFIAFNGVWRVAGVLATSRALGDFPLKERSLVIAHPDTLTFDLASLRPRFMVLASDGLWDAFSNEEAVALLLQEGDGPALHGARVLAQAALRKGSQDNVTVMVVRFQE